MHLDRSIDSDVRYFLALIPVLAAGCADAKLFRAPPAPLVTQIGYTTDALLGEAAYRLGCADVLEVAFADRPEWDCTASVGLDGRLPLGAAGSPVVEGTTLSEVRTAIAKLLNQTPDRITVRLVDVRAGRIYLSGPENNRQRVVPFRGPEPVVEFLWRAGAVKQGCSALHDVYVIRPNVANGTQPETFHVDFDAIVLDADHRSNVILQPSDQVYVGETRRSSFSRLLPNWAKPFYRKLVGLLPPDGWPWAK